MAIAPLETDSSGPRKIKAKAAPVEKEMATHSGVLAWEIPWTVEPGGLQSVGSQELETTD